MRKPVAWVVVLALFGLLGAGGGADARADERGGAASVNAVAKQRQEEFEDLQKKKTGAAANQRLQILQGLAFAPCHTARRFLLGLVKKAATPGDERVVALQSLLHMVDEEALGVVLATLTREKDPTLWQVFSDSAGGARSDVVQAWLKGPALDLRDADALGAVLDLHAGRAAPDLAPRLEELHAKHAKVPGTPDLAARALRALATTKGALAVQPLLLEALRHPDLRVRLVAADLLPGLEPFGPEAQSAVRVLLTDESATVRQSAAARVGAARRAMLADALVPLLGDARVRTRQVAVTALENATGQKLGGDAQAWTAWLAKQDPGKPRTYAFPTYHGVPVQSDRVVFLVDRSSSMTWPWRKSPKRIDVARAELGAVLGSLTPDLQFNVLVYADAQSWFRKTEVAATPENVAAARTWAEKALAEPAGDTHLFEALESAFATDPQFDTVFLLTDGNPTDGRYWTSPSLLASVRAWNRHRRAAIHTIGLSLANEDRGMPNLAEDLGVMASLLSGLAGATAGEYREVLSAPAAK